MKTKHCGHTLLELLVATSVTAIALVPALKLMRTGMEIGRDNEIRSLVTTLCIGKLEEQLNLVAASWTEASESGAISITGYTNIRYEMTRSDETVDGGIPDRLMTVQTTVWHDSNADSTRQSDEIQCTFRSKIASLTTYQSAAGA